MDPLKPEATSSMEPASPIFKNWKLECEAVHKEMDCLLKAGWAETAADRQVRRMQFMALIERRDAAARNLLCTTRRAATLFSFEQVHESG